MTGGWGAYRRRRSAVALPVARLKGRRVEAGQLFGERTENCTRMRFPALTAASLAGRQTFPVAKIPAIRFWYSVCALAPESEQETIQMARIFIVGSGVVGTATGKGFLQAGHQVTFIDVAPRRLDYLRSQGLDARAELDLGAEPDAFIFLTLPTPNVGHRYDLSAFEAGTASVGEALAG